MFCNMKFNKYFFHKVYTHFYIIYLNLTEIYLYIYLVYAILSIQCIGIMIRIDRLLGKVDILYVILKNLKLVLFTNKGYDQEA